MTGSEVFKFAVSAMIRDITDVLPPRVSAPIRLKGYPAPGEPADTLRRGKRIFVMTSLCSALTGRNTSSASIPILLSELFEAASLKAIVVLSAFGGGLTTGACVIEI